MASMFPKPQISGGMSDRMSAIRGLMGGNPEAFAMQALRTNQGFADFVQRNQGKSIGQIASENGVDINLVRNIMTQLNIT